jgi:hypothetical protein
MTAELGGLSAAAAEPKQRPDVLKLLRRWWVDSRLACVRDEAELKKLPEAERAGWRKLWGDVAALQARLGDLPQAPPPRPAGR